MAGQNAREVASAGTKWEALGFEGEVVTADDASSRAEGPQYRIHTQLYRKAISYKSPLQLPTMLDLENDCDVLSAAYERDCGIESKHKLTKTDHCVQGPRHARQLFTNEKLQ